MKLGLRKPYQMGELSKAVATLMSAAEVRHDPPKIFSFWAGRCNLNRVDFGCGSQEGQSVLP